jgi:cell division septation protein DedD
MGHEEIIEPAGVEVDDHGPDTQQPLIVEAVEDVDVVDAVEDSRPVPAPANAPDFYAVGVRLIKMSPVWLLTVTGGFALLILLLSWVRPGGGEADAASIPNDAKAVAVQSTKAPNAPAPSTETHAPAAAPAVDAHREVVEETHPAEAPQAATETPAPVESTHAEQPKEPARVVTPAGDAGGKFTVQVGSFNVESQANERISSLRAAGFDARSTVVEIPGRGTWYRVQVGRFGEREEAAKTAAQLRDKGAAAGSMVVAVQE